MPTTYALLALLALLAFLVAGPLAAQTPGLRVRADVLVQRYGVDDGLPVAHVSGLAVGPDGYLWAATADGLARFDGDRFDIFDVSNTPGLTTNRLRDLVFAPDGALWLRTASDRLFRFAGGVATPLRPDVPPLLTTNRGPVPARGSVWIPTERGLWRWRDGEVRRVRPRTVLGAVADVAFDEGGTMWVVTEGSVLRLQQDGSAHRVSLRRGTSVLPDLDGAGAWVGTQTGIWRLERGRLRRVQRVDFVRGLERRGAVAWAETDEGPYVLLDGQAVPGPDYVASAPAGATGALGGWSVGPDVYLGGAVVLTAPEVQPPSAPFARDSEGGLWANVWGAGLVRIRPRTVGVLGRSDGLSGTNAYPVLESRDGALWLGVWDDPGGNGLVRRAPNGALSRFPIKYPSALAQTRDGAVWTASLGGVFWIAPGTRLLQTVPAREGSVSEIEGATVITEDRRGRVWIGSPRGLDIGTPTGDGRYDWHTERLPAPVLAVVETEGSEFLVGTQGAGLWRRDGDGRWDRLSTRDGLTADAVRDVYEDPRGVLWLALESGGLCRLDREPGQPLASGTLGCLAVRNGLFDNSLHRVLGDDDGRLWISSNRGIFWVLRSEADAVVQGRTPSLTSVGYTERDGLLSREANGGRQPAGVRLRDGRFAFPTQDGVALIDPTTVRIPAPPRSRIEAVAIGDGPERMDPGPSVSMGPGERDLTVAYTGISFSAARAVRFRVRLDGYDDAWRSAGADRRVRYTNLEPGRYRFRVQAGLGGRWGPEASLDVVREPEVWETAGFRVLALLAALAAGLAAVGFGLRRSEARRRELERTVRERTADLAASAEALRRADAAKDRLVANVAHELRTPLTLLLGPLRDLRDGTLDADAVRPLLNTAEVHGRRLEHLIGDLLTMARLDADALRLRPQRVDLGDLARRVAGGFQEAAEDGEVALRVWTPRPVRVEADPAHLETVLINLLANALRHTPPGGTIELTADGARDGARLRVTDTGDGIAPDDLARVFDRFHQGDVAHARAGRGTGLGLALARRLVERHGGTIGVESELGHGARFTVHLPAAPPGGGAADLPEVSASARPEQGDGQASSVPALGTGERPLVLVVDDEPDLRDYIRTLLDGQYRVEEAADGAEAAERASDLVPDLVLSDVMMPRLDGLGMLARLRADDRTAHVPVVLLTARTGTEDRVKALGVGADAYLAKPFDTAELRVTVGRLIDQRRALRERWQRQGATAPTPPEAPSDETVFLDAVRAAAEGGLSESAFGVGELADAVAMSSRQLSRRLKALTGETPGALLRRLRLARAASLLDLGAGTVSEVATAVGFGSRSQFSEAFRKAYGVPPSEYQEGRQPGD